MRQRAYRRGRLEPSGSTLKNHEVQTRFDGLRKRRMSRRAVARMIGKPRRRGAPGPREPPPGPAFLAWWGHAALRLTGHATVSSGAGGLPTLGLGRPACWGAAA